MRQIGTKAAISPIIVDPRRGALVPARRRLPGVFGDLQRGWVLHKALVVRLFAGLICALLIAVLFQARGGIGQAVATVSNLMQGEFAAAGLGVDEISITGQAMTREGDVLVALALNEGTSILGFDAEAARQRILELPSVADVSIRKVYPNKLIIAVQEPEAIARWTVDDATFVIDAAGNQIAKAQPADKALPLVIGDGAADDALVIIRAIGLYPVLSEDLVAISRLADRRWDLIFRTGLRVRLPETGVAQALKDLDSYQDQHQILGRDLALIDLRVPGMVSVRMNPAEDETE